MTAPIEPTLDDLKEVVREAHEVLKDLRAAMKAAAKDADLLKQEFPQMLNDYVRDLMVVETQGFEAEIKVILAEIEDAVINRFDRLEKSLITPVIQTAIQAAIEQQEEFSKEPRQMRAFRKLMED
jgi:hypothetical protein